MIRTWIVKAAGLLLLLASFVVAWYWMEINAWLQAPLQLPEEGLVYEVESGSNFRKVIHQLHQQGVIDRPKYLQAWIRWENAATNIKAGEYRIPAGTNPVQLLALMVKGDVVLHSLTLLEGWDYRQVLAAVQQAPKLTQTLSEVPVEELMTLLGREGVHPEGQFLPETYNFPALTTDLEFLRRANSAMHDVLNSAWEERAEGLPYETPYEALIMASIVEKETGVAAERPEIAGVFVRRLQKGMRLQTDPTVIYGMGENYKGNIRRRDLRQATPYNTYVIKGLPPSPIAMPGTASILASLHPAAGNSLYFVARGDGTHEFSDTLSAHNRAVSKYQLKRKK